jgi:uncharacterized protein YndB with AHSA1/START domain
MLGSRKQLEGKRVGVCELQADIQINVPRDTVWRLTIDRANEWWMDGLTEGSQGVYIEPVVGGRLWERFDDVGNGILYGNVILIDPPNTINFSSTYSLAGVALGTSTWRFMEVDGGTLVAITIELLSEFPERVMCGRIKQRSEVLLQSLKQFVELNTEHSALA